MLHDRVHADHAHRVQPEPAEGVQGEPAAGRRHVRGAGDEERWLERRGRGGRAAAGGRHDDVADVRAERAPVPGHAARGLVERPHPEARAVHDAAAVRRAGAQRRSAAVRVLLRPAAHGGGRNRRDHTAGGHRWPDAVDHDRVQLHGRRYFGE